MVVAWTENCRMAIYQKRTEIIHWCEQKYIHWTQYSQFKIIKNSRTCLASTPHIDMKATYEMPAIMLGHITQSNF